MNRTPNCLRTGLLATVLLAGAVLPALADSAVLGVGCRPENRVLSDKLKERYNVDGGALVDYVLPSSPADQADIRVGDIIVSFQGQRIAGWDALTQAIMASQPGAEVVVVFVRAEKPMEVKVVLGARPTDDQQAAPTQKRKPFTLGNFLKALAAANSAQGQQPGVDQGQGFTGTPDAGNQNPQTDQDYAAAVERDRIQREEEERQRQAQEQEQERLRQLQRQREQLAEEQERARQQYLQALQFQHEQEMLRLQWMYRPPCPPAGSNATTARPGTYYVPSPGSYSRASSGPGLTLPQLWHGMLGVGGALLNAGADTIGALIGK